MTAGLLFFLPAVRWCGRGWQCTSKKQRTRV